MTLPFPEYDPKSLVRHLREEDFESISTHPGNNERDGGSACTLISRDTTNSEDMWVGLVRMAPHMSRRKHYHPHASEFYLVIKGQCTLHVAGEDIQAKYGTAVYVPPNVVHSIRNDTDEMCELIVGFNLPTLEEHGIVFAED